MTGVPEPTDGDYGVEFNFYEFGDAHPTAVCNDGTKGGYDFSQARSKDASHTWIILLESGSWAYDKESYEQRRVWFPYYVTSDMWKSRYHHPNYPKKRKLGGFFHSKDTHLRNANKAYLRYCTSDVRVFPHVSAFLRLAFSHMHV